MTLGSNGVTIGQVTAMTVITPIISDCLGRLRQMLSQPAGPVLGRIATIHFARWVIINDGRDLLFTSNFDGSWEVYLRDFVRDAAEGMDAIWSNCAGYPAGGAADFDAFRTYVDQHELRTDLYYAAYPHLTVKDVLKHERVYVLAQQLISEFG